VEAAVAALRAMSAADATVVRNGERRSLPATELVPGVIPHACGAASSSLASFGGWHAAGARRLDAGRLPRRHRRRAVWADDGVHHANAVSDFNVLDARSDEDSAFARLFTNSWLWAAIGGSVALQVLVVSVPFLQRAFGTTALSGGDWVLCVAVASSVLWLRETSKAVARARR
jgi:magnesium-transporting ATPase (P-type)